MFGECHAHFMMDGKNYRKAAERHKISPEDAWIREVFELYRGAGISFVRDGGDHLGVSLRAKALAPEYGIDYRTPVFAIHKKGQYGSIVGKAFSDLKEYHGLVLEAKEMGADFIKIMTTGLLDFYRGGEITGEPLLTDEVREMVHIAHEEGLSVMSHTNGTYGIRSAILAGVDSLEHGNFMDEEGVSMLAESHTVWVPTVTAVRNLKTCGRYDEKIFVPVLEGAAAALKLAFKKKIKTALGSDAGAYLVPHGKGICQEYEIFGGILGASDELDEWLKSGEEQIKKYFGKSNPYS